MERLDRIEKLIEEVWELQKLTQIQAAKTEAQVAKTEAQVAKTEAQVAKTEVQVAKTEAQLAKTMEQLSNVGNNNGAHAEDYFYNALSESMLFAGIKYDYIDKNINMRKKRLQDEFDVVMYNGNSIAIIECKYKAHENDLKKLVESKVANFRELSPDYANYKIYCGLGSFSFYPELEQQAQDLGVAILKQKGDVMEINAEHIKVY